MPSTHTTMTVHLNEALSDFVSANVGESGTYDNASEYVRELIRRDEEAARQLRAIYQAGIDSGEAIPMTDEDWAALRAEVRSPGTVQA